MGMQLLMSGKDSDSVQRQKLKVHMPGNVTQICPIMSIIKYTNFYFD